MCRDLAQPSRFGTAALCVDSPRRDIFHRLVPGGAAQGEYDGDGQGMARIWSGANALAPSILAQQCMAEEKSVVRKRALARFAGACAAGLVALVFVGCAPAVAPQGLENTTPQLTSDSFITRDGLHLPLREWDAKQPTAVIVALHGMSDYSEAYDMPGPWWAAHGITVFAYDQRGFGAAPDPGVWAGADAMRSDLNDFV